MSLCKWNVRVTYWLCASQTVRLQQSLHGEWEAGVLHRLNRLGAMATCFWEWRSAFWANGGMSWRGRVSKGGEWCRHGFVLPLLSWSLPDEDCWFFFCFFGTSTHTHAHKWAWLILFCGEVMCFFFYAIIARLSEHRLGPFMIVYLCLFVSEVGSIVMAWCWRASRCWLIVYIFGPLYCHRNLRSSGCIWKLELLAFVHQQ